MHPIPPVPLQLGPNTRTEDALRFRIACLEESVRQQHAPPAPPGMLACTFEHQRLGQLECHHGAQGQLSVYLCGREIGWLLPAEDTQAIRDAKPGRAG